MESQVSVPVSARFVLVMKDRETYPLNQGNNTIGRKGDIPVPGDKYMSKIHAKIVINNDRCTLADQQSSNGTLLNGKKVVSVKTLTSGDSIKCGKTLFTFKHEPMTKA